MPQTARPLGSALPKITHVIIWVAKVQEAITHFQQQTPSDADSNWACQKCHCPLWNSVADCHIHSPHNGPPRSARRPQSTFSNLFSSDPLPYYPHPPPRPFPCHPSDLFSSHFPTKTYVCILIFHYALHVRSISIHLTWSPYTGDPHCAPESPGGDAAHFKILFFLSIWVLFFQTATQLSEKIVTELFGPNYLNRSARCLFWSRCAVKKNCWETKGAVNPENLGTAALKYRVIKKDGLNSQFSFLCSMRAVCV
jgi:hypothetical protein